METKKGTTVKDSNNDFPPPEEDEGFAIGDGDEANGDRDEEIASRVAALEAIFAEYDRSERAIWEVERILH